MNKKRIWLAAYEQVANDMNGENKKISGQRLNLKLADDAMKEVNEEIDDIVARIARAKKTKYTEADKS